MPDVGGKTINSHPAQLTQGKSAGIVNYARKVLLSKTNDSQISVTNPTPRIEFSGAMGDAHYRRICSIGCRLRY